MDMFKKAAETAKGTFEGVQDAVKIYSQLNKEKKNLREAEEKVRTLYEEVGRMVYMDAVKSSGVAESVFINVNYRTKLNVIIGVKEKIKEIEAKIESINRLL